VGVGVLIQKNERFLLIKRGAEPDLGLWSVPGGLVELGETVKEAAIREVFEETGIVIGGLSLLDVIDKIITDEKGDIRYHFVIIDYLAKKLGGELEAKDDALDARWVNLRELNKFELTPTLKALFQKMNLY
jgi:mutator protein MutT